MKFEDEIFDLMDNSYRENAIEVMNDWLKYPKDHSLENREKVLNEQVIEPINKWLESEWLQLKGNPNNYAHIEAAQKFKIYAEDLAYRFKNNLTVVPECIPEFDKRWRELQIQVGWGAIWEKAEHRAAQKKKSKKQRGAQELNEFIEQLAKQRDYKVKELWPELISLMEKALMVPKETGNPKNNKTLQINYVTDKGEKSLKFSTFKNKISKARKKLSL